MARFTTLTPYEYDEIATAYGLGAVTAARPLDGGTINSNVSLTTAKGRYFLRVNEGKTEADVAYEAELVAALSAAGVATPEPLRAPDGRPYLVRSWRLYSAFPWIDGGHREAAEVSTADCAALGAALGALHVAGRPLAARFARDGIYTTAHIAARVAGLVGHADPDVAAAAEVLDAEHRWLAGHAAARAAAPRGVIHGDLFRDNVLFDGDALVALIDFEQAAVGSLVYDVAVCLNAWCYVEAFDPTLIAALLDGYARVRRFEDAERALLPVEVRAAAARFATTRITDVYLARSGVPGKDFRRFLARLEAWRAMGDGWAG